MPKVSIIIPIYNVEKYLRQCLDSVVNQTLDDIEIICVNDGSPDNSQDIIDEYAKKDKRIVPVKKENGGYASAINYGLDIAKGEFIGIVESDDYCALNMYEKLYNKISETNADYVIGDFYFFKSKNNLKRYTLNINFDFNNESTNIQTSPKLISNPSYPWKNLYRASFLKENNIKMLTDNKGAYEDIPWNATILSKAKSILYVNEPLYYYRIFALNSSTNVGTLKLLNDLKRRYQAKEIYIENNLYSGDIKEYFALFAIRGAFDSFRKIAFEFKEEYYNEMKKLLIDIIDEDIKFKYFPRKWKNRVHYIKLLPYKIYYGLPILINSIKRLFNAKKRCEGN